MKEKELKKKKKEYEELILLKQKLIHLMKKAEKLEKKGAFQKLFEIQSEMEKSKYNKIAKNLSYLSKKQLLERAIQSQTITKTNGIYVYMGTMQSLKTKCLLPFHDEKATHRRFWDIEKIYEDGNGELIEIAQCDSFEKKNIVLYSPKNEFDFLRYYENVRLLFFETAIKKGQKCAKKVILEKRKKHPNRMY